MSTGKRDALQAIRKSRRLHRSEDLRDLLRQNFGVALDSAMAMATHAIKLSYFSAKSALCRSTIHVSFDFMRGPGI
jgi:hypothetical protein